MLLCGAKLRSFAEGGATRGRKKREERAVGAAARPPKLTALPSPLIKKNVQALNNNISGRSSRSICRVLVAPPKLSGIAQEAASLGSEFRFPCLAAARFFLAGSKGRPRTAKDDRRPTAHHHRHHHPKQSARPTPQNPPQSRIPKYPNALALNEQWSLPPFPVCSSSHRGLTKTGSQASSPPHLGCPRLPPSRGERLGQEAPPGARSIARAGGTIGVVVPIVLPDAPRGYLRPPARRRAFWERERERGGSGSPNR